MHSKQDGLFNGPQCEGDASICVIADDNGDNNFITVRKAGVLITSGSTSRVQVYDRDSESLIYDSANSDLDDPIVVAASSVRRVQVRITDPLLQMLPHLTGIDISSDPLIGTEGTQLTVNNIGCSADSCGTFVNYVISNDVTAATTEVLTVTTTTNNLVTTLHTIEFNLQN
jgi:hypothetical protein